MKKLLFILMLLISISVSAQHLTFQGVEINGTPKEFIQNIKNKNNCKIYNCMMGNYSIQYDGNQWRPIHFTKNKDKNLYQIDITYLTEGIQPKYDLIEKLKKAYNVTNVIGNMDSDYILVIENVGKILISRISYQPTFEEYGFIIRYVDNLNCPLEYVKSNNI